MKMNKIALAVALASIAPSAFAGLDLTTQSIPAGNIYYMSGATAQTPALAKTFQSWCASSSINTYTSPNGKDALLYYCTSALASVTVDGKTLTTPFTGGQKFLIVKMEEGGSFNGVGPVAANGDLSALVKWPSLDCTGAASTAAPAAAVVGTNSGSCTLETTARRPQLGISDVPKTVWKARNQLTAAVDAKIDQKAGFGGQGFGVVVSPLLYAALQKDQFGVVGTAYNGSDRPSISTTQYAALVSSGVGAWDILLPKTAALYRAAKKTADAASAAVIMPTLPGYEAAANGTFPPSAALTVSRRVATSGTQAASDIYFLNNPCSGTTLPGSLNAKGLAAAGTDTVTDSAYYTTPNVVSFTSEASSSGVKTAVKTGYTIGVISLENAESGLSNAKFLKLNGVDPIADAYQKSNILNGAYDFAYESVLITPNSVTSTVATPAAITSGVPTRNTLANVQGFVNKLAAFLGNGNTLTTMAGVYADPYNSGGLLVEGQTSHYSRNNAVCKNASWKW